ncbi:hypothetical protein F2Q69_00027218 [Brassica cretica]|uniref:Uncharacterized protein n=1 Tax=Brassica cretica TaxID=69181 RepID=A0A8S9S509_BRACR|nr:hypothetical protein F2Q69_00027218 [Brassica cretica]
MEDEERQELLMMEDSASRHYQILQPLPKHRPYGSGGCTEVSQEERRRVVAGCGGHQNEPAGGNQESVSIYRFKDDLEESSDFGIFWSLLSAELHRRIRCLAMDGDLSNHPVAEVIPVLLKSGQSALREKAVEEMKDCRSMVHPCHRSTEYSLSVDVEESGTEDHMEE